MHGGAQAAMVLTDHGHYVVKWKQNSQHRRVLINEVLAAELLLRLGIASPEWAMVQIDREFLHTNPLAGIELRNTFRPAECGWHFGSKVPVNPNVKAILDVLPPHLLPQIENLPDFFRVLVFDLWTDNRDKRQSIYFIRKGRQFSTQMIDNGHAFGFDGSQWRMRDQFIGKNLSLLSDAYLSMQAEEHFESTIASIQSIVATGLDPILQLVPADWIENDAKAITILFDDLGRRSKRLPDLLTDAKAHLAGAKSASLDKFLCGQIVEYTDLNDPTIRT
jgi:hypothetical protein